jgi:nucleoid-associated protein YgaU
MRRLVGLIALLVLILGAAWLARIDFDLTRIAEFNTLFEPAGQGSATKSSESAPTETAAEPSLPPDASQSETDVATTPEGAESQLADTSEMAVGKPMPDEFDTTGPSSVETAAAESVEHPTDAGTVLEAAPRETNTAVAEPADEGAVPPAVPPVDVPSFDIVRVEPTGETVIAGTAEPEAMVEVLDGPEPVASAEANDRGEWALVLETPLPPGTHDLGIRMTSPDQSQVTSSNQRVAVSVPESADEEPLVVLNQPDAPSQVMQLPAGAETAAGAEVATASEPHADAMAEPTPSGETEVASAPQAETTAEMSAASGEAKMATSSSEAAPPTASMETHAAETKAASTPDSKPMAKPSMSSDASEKPAAAPAAETASEAAAAPPAARPAEAGSETMAATPETPPAGTMAAGSAAASSEPPAAMGETTSEPPSASAPSAATEMATAPPAPPSEASAAPETVAGGTSAAESEAKAPTVAEAPPPPTPKVGVAAVEAETNGALYIAGTATTPEPVRVYVDNEFLGEAKPTESGTWLLETNRELAPDEYTIRADQIDAGSGTVVARAEVPFAREIAVAALKPVGESVAASTAEASGAVADPRTVIIKRGDNLWRISREMYGHGIRYSTIYQANRDQIRNPNRIYPGQVFVLPAGDINWQN